MDNGPEELFASFDEALDDDKEGGVDESPPDENGFLLFLGQEKISGDDLFIALDLDDDFLANS